MKAVISGYGKMGHLIEDVLRRRGIECAGATEDVASFDDAVAKDCVCIDFTTPEAFRANYPVLAKKFKAVVVGTTGWYDIKDEVIACFEKAGTTMIWSSNYSIGVLALFAAVEKVSGILRDKGYLPDIHEIHHIHKLDSPSGTAKSLASIVEEGMGVEPEISAERIGEVPGTHSVSFLSSCDRLTFTHEAFSREGFAQGAVTAALMTEGLEGVHEFKNLILE